MALKANEVARLLTKLHEAAGEGDTQLALATSIGRLALARTAGGRMGAAIDEELRRLLGELENQAPSLAG